MKEKVLERVRKMLAIANDAAASEHERDTALQMALKTLAHHNLAMVDVESHTREKDDPRDEFRQQGYSMPWARHVNNMVAGMFFCSYFFGGKINGTQCWHYFVGRESNATTAMLMSTYVVTSILKECRKRFGGSITSPESRSFATGAMNRLGTRIRQIIENQKKESASTKTGSGTEIVLADIYKREGLANEEFIQSSGRDIKIRKSRETDVVGSAYRAGKEFGDNINLSPQISNSSKSSKLLK